MQNPEIDPHKYTQLIFDKVQKYFNRGKLAFSTNDTGVTGHP